MMKTLEETISNLTSSVVSNEASCVSSTNRSDDNVTTPLPSQPPLKKKRNLPGHPDPDAEVIALSPRTLLATNRFVCDICNKGFQRDQNLQLHRRGHNLPWKLKQRSVNKEMGGVVRKKVYVCPETTCVHHEASRALGDLTGIKKHFCRKHGEKKWKCEKCSKKYAVQSDWKAHAKVCGTREYRCDCGTLFSRRDSFITHRAFCGALAEENTRKNYPNMTINNNIAELVNSNHHELLFQAVPIKKEDHHLRHHYQNFRQDISPWLLQSNNPHAIGQGRAGPPAPAGAVDFPHPATSGPLSAQMSASPAPFPTGDFIITQHVSSSSSSSAAAVTGTGPPPGEIKFNPLRHSPPTALLQKAAQMSSSPAPLPTGEFIITQHGSSSSSSSAAAVTGTGAPAGEINFNPPPSSSSYLHGFDAPANFDETLKFFEQFNNSSSSDNKYGDGETQTRDFLGLRGFSDSDQILMSMAGLSEYMNSNTASDHGKTTLNQQHRSWQD